MKTIPKKFAQYLFASEAEHQFLIIFRPREGLKDGAGLGVHELSHVVTTSNQKCRFHQPHRLQELAVQHHIQLKASKLHSRVFRQLLTSSNFPELIR